ncbi:hypothetical protein [Bradyrhizobium prioriisuperbiae]|uniref:hypothetical protein n=1 Tax=Bradyrhizobium prioriisuperbiae TaxID=2854389 RepID=UPI0028EAE8CE|nr:hypothetical protein [Bradyrhizobium prioritasuperba]
MHTFSVLRSGGQAEQSTGAAARSDLSHAAVTPAVTAQLRQAMNESAAASAMTQLKQSLNQCPAVVAQRQAAQDLSSRSIVQRYTYVSEGSFRGKRSQYGRYVTGEDLSEMYARPGNDVERSTKTSETAVIDGRDYDVWKPSFDVIQDCVAAMEELMHGEKLKYGAPELSAFRDSTKSTRFFGDSDQSNRTLGKETDLGASADPGLLEGFVIARQGYKRKEARPQFHGATVVAQDGNDSVTLETTAPTSGSISRTRVDAVYDMYGSSKTKKQSFKHAYQAEYGSDATVSVIEPVKPLPKGTTVPMSEKMVIDF